MTMCAHKILVHGDQYCDAVDAWANTLDVSAEEFFEFDHICGLRFLAQDSVHKTHLRQAKPRYFVFEVVDPKAFIKACLKWGWATKSYGDDQRLSHHH
jgi:hypothetical protein